MTTATSILATAHTLGQVRRAALKQCVGSVTDHPNFAETYRFADLSTIQISNKKITTGSWEWVSRKVIRPSLRQCTTDDCWNCGGTGLHASGEVCTANGELPF